MDKEFLEKMYDKQEAMANDLSDIKVILAKQEESLRHHIYRTELAEESIELLRTQVSHINKHVDRVDGALKLIGLASVLVGLIAGIQKVFF